MLASGWRTVYSSSSARLLSTSAARCNRYDPKLFAEPVLDTHSLNAPLDPEDEKNYKFIKVMNSQYSPVFYRDHVVDKLVRVCMKDGKKETSRTNILGALEKIKRRQYKAWARAKTDDEKTAIEIDAFAVTHKAIRNCTPLMKLLPVTRGGTTYQVPFPIPPAEAEFRAMKTLRDICRQKAKKGETSFADIMATELIAASKNEGLTIQAKQELHKQCEANRAYSHFRS
ncbi:hypothetical protein L596_005628 [Steinernema carpocapsae]|uniref:Small ribosomal subunit protein uS7m n=1 Tax=Steinernema carpocapsae TaxID=34508 RepID=A0A4U8V0V1_STECR|nr:hypothetical protein L596_005628 [Steinernema carpocapsae]